MEDIERYLEALRHSASIAKKIEDILLEDKQNIHRGLSGEAEGEYKHQCDEVAARIKKIEKTIRILYSESSTGLI